MVKASFTTIWILCLLGVALADQICMRTQTRGWWSDNMVSRAGTDCVMRVKAYVNNYGWKYAFIDKHSSSNWRSTNYGWAYVSRQRVHEHTDSCFEMQSGFGTVDLGRGIWIRFVDGSCDDAAWIDQFFIPGRKSWGVHNALGWCMNGKKNLWPLDSNPNTRFLFGGARKVRFNTGCAREWKLHPNGAVYATQWGSSNGLGNRGSGRRALKVLPMQSVRFEGLKESERNEISLIEDLYDVCESYSSGDGTDRYDRETEKILRSCFDMLEPFYKTYVEFQEKEDNAIPEAMRFASETMEETKGDEENEEDKDSEEEFLASKEESLPSKSNGNLKISQRLIEEEQKEENKDAMAAASNP